MLTEISISPCPNESCNEHRIFDKLNFSIDITVIDDAFSVYSHLIMTILAFRMCLMLITLTLILLDMRIVHSSFSINDLTVSSELAEISDIFPSAKQNKISAMASGELVALQIVQLPVC